MAQISPTRVGWGDLRRDPEDPRPPAPLVVGLAFLTELAWVVLAQALGLSGSAALIGILAIAVAASWWATVPSSVWVAVVSLLVADGFVQNQMGQLGWDGNHDALLLLALLVGCALSADVRTELIVERRRRGADRSEDPAGR